MNTVDIKKELHEFIDKGDPATIRGFYNMLKSYVVKHDNDKKIQESENDIKSGNVLTHQQVKDIIATWKK